jgi:hypothetical protein
MPLPKERPRTKPTVKSIYKMLIEQIASLIYNAQLHYNKKEYRDANANLHEAQIYYSIIYNAFEFYDKRNRELEKILIEKMLKLTT